MHEEAGAEQVERSEAAAACQATRWGNQGTHKSTILPLSLSVFIFVSLSSMTTIWFVNRRVGRPVCSRNSRSRGYWRMNWMLAAKNRASHSKARQCWQSQLPKLRSCQTVLEKYWTFKQDFQKKIVQLNIKRNKYGKSRLPDCYNLILV